MIAEALVDIYSRLGISEEMLSDMETQFVSECMSELSRLLRKQPQQLRTTQPVTVLWKNSTGHYKEHVETVVLETATSMEPISQCLTLRL